MSVTISRCGETSLRNTSGSSSERYSEQNLAIESRNKYGHLDKPLRSVANTANSGCT